jgi:hypothetical protein
VREFRLKITSYAETGTIHYQHTSPTLEDYNPYGGIIRRTVEIHIIALNHHFTLLLKFTELNKLSER